MSHKNMKCLKSESNGSAIAQTKNNYPLSRLMEAHRLVLIKQILLQDNWEAFDTEINLNHRVITSHSELI